MSESKKIEIYVDGDACPVKDEVLKVAERHKLTYHVVSNSWMRLTRSVFLNQVVVSDSFDAADDWIAENITGNDIAITSDIPLAERCVHAGAKVLKPNGKPFSDDNIGMAMAMRELTHQLDDMGKIKRYNAAFSKADRSNFLQGLEKAVQELKRG